MARRATPKPLRIARRPPKSQRLPTASKRRILDAAIAPQLAARVETALNDTLQAKRELAAARRAFQLAETASQAAQSRHTALARELSHLAQRHRAQAARDRAIRQATPKQPSSKRKDPP
jgi:hypothetical protein